MSRSNTEWVVTFLDYQNTIFRIQDNNYYIYNQKPAEGKGMSEMDFCYCNESSIDLIECKESLSPGKRLLKEDCVDKALHSVALLKTALHSMNSHILEDIRKVGRDYQTNIVLNIYFIFNIQEVDKNTFPPIAIYIEKEIKKFLTDPLGRIWNVGKVRVYHYEQARTTLNYISGETRA